MRDHLVSVIVTTDRFNQILVLGLIMLGLAVICFPECSNECVVAFQAGDEEYGKLVGRVPRPRIAEVNDPFQLPFIVQIHMIFGQVLMDKALVFPQSLALEV